MLASALTRPLDRLDALLDKLTTFRLVLYLLIIYVVAAAGLASTHRLSFSATSILLSAVWLMAVCRFVNWVLGRWFNVPRNHESDLITGLILSLILTPTTAHGAMLITGAAAAVAMVSKYVLSSQKHHIFNPAAVGALASGVILHSYASWWIGSQPLLPFVIIGALLIWRKMKRGTMAAAFLLVFAIYTVLSAHGHAGQNLSLGFEGTAIIFFASVMLTEPLTSPTTLGNGLIYAIIVGIFYSVSKLRLSPEEALLVGNGVAFLLSPGRSLILNLKEVRQEAAGIHSYIFSRPANFNFSAGQYMEWTLPKVGLDSRGNRRYLTIASAPTETELMFTIRQPASKMSNFKSKLSSLKPGQPILATQLAGSFTLPEDARQKLVFLAGGVGITPFRSMVKHLLDKKQVRDVHLFYGAKSPSEFAFVQLFRDAGVVGLKTHYVAAKPSPNWRGATGYITGELVRTRLPDYKERVFYISGPQAFVASMRQQLLGLGVPHGRIVTDFFPGYNS